VTPEPPGPDLIFAHPRLAAIYDAFDGDRDDLDAYVAVVNELGAGHVLDIGCGTGALAVRLAQQGTRVTGVDPAAASLDVARAKPGGAAVTWLAGDARTLPVRATDLAVMTGNVAQVFLSDVEWDAVLAAVRDALTPGGHFVFETRRPDYRAWDHWAADSAPHTVDVPEVGIVEERREVTRVDLPFVGLRHTYTFAADDVVLVSDSTLRFRDRAEVEAALTHAGFVVVDVRDAPDRPGREFVFLARRTP
jgi:SAM-dependent methyltransferase